MSIEDYDWALRTELASIRAMLLDSDDDALARRSPCPGWSVLDVGRHVEVTPRALLCGLVAHARGKAASATEPIAETARQAEVAQSLHAAAQQLSDALRQLSPQDLDGQLPGPFGPMPGRRVLDLALTEITLHRCDIALGLRRPVTIERPVAEAVLDVVHAWLLLIAPADPKPSEPLCYHLSDGSPPGWQLRFDGDRWIDERCSDDDRTVTARGNVGDLVLGLAGRMPIEKAVADTSDAAALAMLKTYLPGP